MPVLDYYEYQMYAEFLRDLSIMQVFLTAMKVQKVQVLARKDKLATNFSPHKILCQPHNIHDGS